MFEGLSVSNSNNVAPPTTTDNSNNLTSLFGDMSIQVLCLSFIILNVVVKAFKKLV